MDPAIDIESLQIFIENGLESKTPSYLPWKQQFDLDRQKRQDRESTQLKELRDSQRQDPKFATAGLIRWLTDYAAGKHP